MIPTKKQIQALNYLTDNVTEFIGYGGGAGGGKTYIGCFWLMQLAYYAPKTRYFIGRDSLKDTRASVQKSFQKLANSIEFTQFKFNDIGIAFDNGSEIEFLDLSYYPYKDPLFERFGSKEYTAGWIEEAGQVHYLAFEVLKTRIGRWLNDEFKIKKKILCTFNPKKNWVDDFFYRPFKKNEQNIDTKFIFALAKDNPHLPEDYIETLQNLKDNSTRERLLNGNFDYDDDPTALIDYSSIKSIWDNDFVQPDLKNKYIVCDVARYGSDKAIITVWYGFVLKEFVTYDLSSTVKIAQTIQSLRVKHQISAFNCIADEDGVGGGVIDQIKIRGFVNNSQPQNKNYVNLKSECGYKLAEMIENIYFEAYIQQNEKDKIEQELGQLKTFESDKDNKLRILPKEKIKENIGRSPDWLDVFIMRMYFEIHKTNFKPRATI